MPTSDLKPPTLLLCRSTGSVLTNDKFNIIGADFNYHAVSAMDIAVSRGILKGRPFREVGFLWHKCFDSNIPGCLVTIRLVGTLSSNLTLIKDQFCYLMCTFLVSSQELIFVLRLPIIWVL